MSQVAAALDAIASGQVKEPWLVLRAIVNDQEIPSEFVDRVRMVLSSMDLTAIYRQEKGIAIIAAVFASQQAPRLGVDLVSYVREQLIALTRELATDRTPAPDEHAVQALLSCPIYLYSRADSDNGTRFTHIAHLFEEMVTLLPRMLDRMQYLVDRLVEGLSNHHASALWALQVRLRALR